MQALQYKMVLGSSLASLVLRSNTGKRFFASFVEQSSAGSALRKPCRTMWYWALLCASLLVRCGTGQCFVQALLYEVVLGSALCKLCSFLQTL